MSALQAALELVGSHCDLGWRVAQVPPSAAIRGVYARSLERTLAEHGRTREYESLFGARRVSLLSFMPLHEFLPRLAVAGALLHGVERLHHGVSELGRQNAQAVTRSLLGRTLLRLFSPDPERMLRQGVAAQRQTANYARWQVDFPRPGRALMRFADEYVWIESYLVGAAHGTFEMVGLSCHVACELERPFSGTHILTWPT